MSNKKYAKRLMNKFLQVFLTTFALLMIVIGIGTVIYVVVMNKNIGTPVLSSDFSETAYPEDSLLDGEVAKGPLSEKKLTTVAVFGVDKDGYRTDVNMLVFFNHETYKIDIVSIPRDTKVKIPDEIYQDIKSRRPEVSDIVKINEVPAYIVDDRNEASVAVLEKSLGVDIDYFVRLKLDVFREIVDIIGNITVDIPEDMDYDDPAQDLYIHLKAGSQELNGAQAEQLIRYRAGYSNGDLGRIEMQHNFMKAFVEQLLTTKNRVNMVNILATILMKVDTNFETAVDYLIFLDKIKAENFEMHMLPGQTDGSSRSYFIYDYEATKLLFNKIVNEPYLAVTEEAPEIQNGEPVVDVEPSLIIDPKTLKVSVQNGTNVSGLAGKNRDRLMNSGYNVVDASDYDTKPVERTRVLVPDASVYDAFAAFFKSPEMVVVPAMIDEAFQVIIIVGQDEGN